MFQFLLLLFGGEPRPGTETSYDGDRGVVLIEDFASPFPARPS